MKKASKEELEKQFRSTGIFISFLIFMLICLFIDYFNDYLNLWLSSISGIVVVLGIFMAARISKNKIRATSYFVIKIIHALIMLVICFNLQQICFYNAREHYYFVLGVTLLVLCLVILVEAKRTVKKWDIYQKLWESNKKINISKGHFNILVYGGSAEELKGNQQIFYWMTLLTPLILIIARRIDRVFEIREIAIFVCSFLVMMFITYYAVAKNIGILIKLITLEKEQQLIFTTEYRDLETEK